MSNVQIIALYIYTFFARKVAKTPLPQRICMRNHHTHHPGPKPAAVNVALLHKAAAVLEHTLDPLGGHKLALRQLEEVLLAIDDLDLSRSTLQANISRTKVTARYFNKRTRDLKNGT